MLQANATYSVKNWDRRPWHGTPDRSADVKLFRLEMTHVYEGIIEGEATIQYLMSQKGSNEVNWVGFEKVTGRVGDKSGTFVFQRIGVSDNGKVRETVIVLPGSGTGDLTGLSGQTTLEHAGHRETFNMLFEYEL
ncbi:MAG: DUF3224 domain-containing protein [Chloroflexota bacterium]